MVQLQEDLAAITETKTRLVGISYDSVETLEKFSEKKQIKFALLSDPKSTVIDAYKIRNDLAKGDQAGIPHPTTFLIDSAGKIRARLNGTVVKRHTTKELLDAIEQLKKGET